LRLSRLLEVLSIPLDESFNCDIQHIVFNSNEAQKGDLFVAVPGLRTDGHAYIDDAIMGGASAVIGEQAMRSLPVPYFMVSNARLAIAKLAAELYGHPYRIHTMIGITGTNGKTTTAHMIRHILEYALQSCSLFGTVERYMNSESSLSNMTTYDAVQLQQWLHQSKDKHVIMEVSSHGLAQHRVDGMKFDFALFTNLSHEHLDYHSTLDHYFSAKQRLFYLLKDGGEAIVNISCPWGKQLAEKLQQEGFHVNTFGRSEGDTLQLLSVENSVHIRFQVRENGNIHTLKLLLPGIHNVWNAMAAMLLTSRMAVPFPVIAEALASFPGVPGRLENYPHPNGARFVIDYAHTPDGLLQCLETMSVYKPRRLVHIFGFRGDRDDSKWEVMLEVSNRYCNETILTLDDLNSVLTDSMLGWYERLQGTTTTIIADRTLALAHAWEQASPGDCIVVTGKGHETYQSSFALDARSDLETLLLLQKKSKHLV
jgi:UDP-N-acetylmuramoyl-L-alanyl-D-glutamate--2,6-diaminopimelate ligase